jgi:hypothetical protein
VCAGFGYYYSTKKNEDGAGEDEENSPLLRKK